jgi:hypothetical protein
LVEKFFEEKVSPFFNKFEIATRNRNVGRVYTVLQNLLLAFEKRFAASFIEEKVSIIARAVYAFCLQSSFKRFTIFCVFRHISGKDCAHHPAFECF